jgi:hypothetical protein
MQGHLSDILDNGSVMDDLSCRTKLTQWLDILNCLEDVIIDKENVCSRKIRRGEKMSF